MRSGGEHKITLFEAVSYCIGDIIGSGIFVSPTSVLKHSGSLGLSLVIWVVSAGISIIGALVYIELGTSIRKSGCDYAYLTHAGWYPIASSFLFVATTLTYPTTMAIQSMAFGEYFVKGLNQLFDWDFETSGSSNLPRLIGFSALLPLAFINLFSLRKFAGRFQIVATAAKLIVISVIIVTGFWHLIVKGKTQNFQNSFQNTTKDPEDVVMALYNGLFSYNGWDVLNFGVEEIDNPRRTLPIAAFTGISVSAFVYISMNLAYFSVLSIDEFKHSDQVAVTFAQKTLGGFHYAMPFLISLLLLGSMNSGVFATSRYLLAGAKNNVMPTMFKCIHPESMSPRAAVMAEVLMAICISFAGNLEQLLSYTAFAMWLMRTLVQLALIYMRFKQFPFPKDAFKNIILVPLLFLAICIALLVIPVKNDWVVGVYGTGFMLVGFAIYYIFIYPKNLPKIFHQVNQKLVTVTEILLDAIPVADAPADDLASKENPAAAVDSSKASDSVTASITSSIYRRKSKLSFADDWE